MPAPSGSTSPERGERHESPPPAAVAEARGLEPAGPAADPAADRAAAARAAGPPRADEPPARLRVLVPAALAGGVIGRKGETIKRLRREAEASITVEDQVAGCEWRVVVVSAQPATGGGGEPGRGGASSAGDALCSVFDALRDLQRGAVPAAVVASQLKEAGWEPQTFDDGDKDGGEAGGGAAAADEGGQHELRLLVDASQVGHVVGRGGAAVRDTSARSGASVRVLPATASPPCAWTTDRVVSVAGTPAAVTAALHMLADQLASHPPRPPPAPPLLVAHARQQTRPGQPFVGGPGGPPGGGGGGGAPAGPEVSFLLLVPAGRAGNIIGRGGEAVRRARDETGARVKVHDGDAGAAERLVAFSSADDLRSGYCGAQDALLRAVIALAGDDASAPLRVRLLVPSAATGTLRGPRGETLAALRAESGAAVRLGPGGPPLPAAAAAAAAPGDEPVTVEGGLHQVVAAVRGLATLLRTWRSRQAARAGGGGGGGGGAGGGGMPPPAMNGGGMPLPMGAAFMPPPGPFLQMQMQAPMQQQAFDPSLAASYFAPPPQQHFQQQQGFDPYGGQVAGMLPPDMQQQQQPFPGAMMPGGGMTMLGGGYDPYGGGGMPFQAPPFQQQGMPFGDVQQQQQQQPLAASFPGGGGMGGTGGMGGGGGGGGGGARAPLPPGHVVWSYALEKAQVGAVVGKGGANISAVRSATGARVTLASDAGAGGTRALEVAGPPEACSAAHGMINAHLAANRCSPVYPMQL